MPYFIAVMLMGGIIDRPQYPLIEAAVIEYNVVMKVQDGELVPDVEKGCYKVAFHQVLFWCRHPDTGDLYVADWVYAKDTNIESDNVIVVYDSPHILPDVLFVPTRVKGPVSHTISTYDRGICSGPYRQPPFFPSLRYLEELVQ